MRKPMPCVLIADDETMVRSMLREVFRTAGFQTIEVGNGEEALRLLEEHEVDLAVMDLIMPETEGLETIIQLRKLYPNLKIIAITGGLRGGSVDLLPMAKVLGAHRSFQKPVSGKDLIAAANELLGPS